MDIATRRDRATAPASQPSTTSPTRAFLAAIAGPTLIIGSVLLALRGIAFLPHLTDQHPDVRIAKSRLADAEARVRETNAALIAAAGAPDDPYEPSGADKSRLERELQKTEREIQMRKSGIAQGASASAFATHIVELEKQWKALNRERERARGQLARADDRLSKARVNEESELAGYSASVTVMSSTSAMDFAPDSIRDPRSAIRSEVSSFISSTSAR